VTEDEDDRLVSILLQIDGLRIHGSSLKREIDGRLGLVLDLGDSILSMRVLEAGYPRAVDMWLDPK